MPVVLDYNIRIGGIEMEDQATIEQWLDRLGEALRAHTNATLSFNSIVTIVNNPGAGDGWIIPADVDPPNWDDEDEILLADPNGPDPEPPVPFDVARWGDEVLNARRRRG